MVLRVLNGLQLPSTDAKEPLTPEQNFNFKNETICHICKGQFASVDMKNLAI